MIRNESVKVTFYRIQACGYYPHGAAEPAFGGIADTFEQLAQWSEGMDLSLTKLFDPDGPEQPYPVYLAGMAQSDGAWVFSTWNEVPAHESGVASISSNSLVGAPVVHMNEVAENSIAGYATYFWVVPARNVIASIRFVHNVSGQQQMRTYLERFLATESKYVLTEENDDGTKFISGYSPDGEPQGARTFPRFKTAAFINPGEREYILANADRIRRVIRRGRLDTHNVIERRWWEGVAGFLRVRAPEVPRVVVDKSALVSLEYTPTIAELEQMIDEQEADQSARGWDDMGFKLQGETAPRWLGRSTASENFLIPVDRLNEEVVDLNHLAQTLHHRRADLLSLLLR